MAKAILAGRPPPEELHRLYWEERLSLTAIGKRLGVAHSTVRCWLRTAGVPRRGIAEALEIAYREGRLQGAPLRPTPARLRELYHSDRLSGGQIAALFGTTRQTVHKWLRKAGIAARSVEDARTLAVRRGRMGCRGNRSGAALTQYVKENPAAVAANMRRAQLRSVRVKQYRSRVYVPCFWCGRRVRRLASQIKEFPRSCCSRSCISALSCHDRYHRGEGRPLILKQLLEGAAAREIGAAEPELTELLLQETLARLEASR